jgi:hypothetical protein
VRLLSRPEFEQHLLLKMGADGAKACREIVIETILATDLAVHFENLGKFSAQVAAGGFDMSRAADRSLKLSTLVHLADVCNPSKTWGEPSSRPRALPSSPPPLPPRRHLVLAPPSARRPRC